MTTTLVINTPDASRNNWKAICAALNRQGLELRRYHSRITDTGMCLVAWAYHPDGREETRARAALAGLRETTLHALH